MRITRCSAFCSALWSSPACCELTVNRVLGWLLIVSSCCGPSFLPFLFASFRISSCVLVTPLLLPLLLEVARLPRFTTTTSHILSGREGRSARKKKEKKEKTGPKKKLAWPSGGCASTFFFFFFHIFTYRKLGGSASTFIYFFHKINRQGEHGKHEQRHALAPWCSGYQPTYRRCSKMLSG